MAFTHIPLKKTAPFGVAAYLVALALVTAGYAVLVPDLLGSVTFAGGRTLVENFAATDSVPPDWTVAGWVFYNTNLVTVSVPTIPGVDMLRETNLLWSAGGVGLLLFVVPPMILTAAGFAAARTAGSRGTAQLYAGASIAVGYAPLVIIGLFVFSFEYVAGAGATPLTSGMNSSALLTPNMLTALPVAGIGYPALFGGLGGALAEYKTTRNVGISSSAA